MSLLAIVAAFAASSDAFAEFVVVVGRQRSSSTWLSLSITDMLLDQHVLTWHADEPWVAGSSRSINIELDEMLWRSGKNWTHQERMLRVFDFVREARMAWCLEKRHLMGAKSRCVMVFKLFDAHFFYATPSRVRMSADLLVPLFAHRGTRIVTVERDVISEYCSLMWAQKTNEWWLPNASHASRERYNKFLHSECDPQSLARDPGFASYSSQHADWFRIVNSALLRAHNNAWPPPARRYIATTYLENVQHHNLLMDRIKGMLNTG